MLVGSSGADEATGRLIRRWWTSEAGLPQNTVQALAQTGDGYLWVGTQEGLARFDGMSFTQPESSSPGWLTENITALHTARDGGLWIGTRRSGVARFLDGAIVALQPHTPAVRSLYEARDGRLWIGTEDGLVCVLGAAIASRNLAGQVVHAFHEDTDGIWVGATRGLYLFRNGAAEPPELHETGGPTRAIHPRRAGGLWLATDGAGLLRMVEGHLEPVVPVGAQVRAIVEDRSGTVWLASEDGLRRVDQERLEPVAGVSGRLIALLEDREGNLWVGSRYEGLARLTRPKVAVHGPRADGSFPTVLSVHEDGQGDIWFGTAGAGLGRLAGPATTFLSREQGLADDIVGPVLARRDGSVWFGTRGAPLLYRLHDRRLTSTRLEASAASLFEDAQGTLWVGTTGAGLYRWGAGGLERFALQGGENTIRAIDSDQQDGLWLGTSDGLVHLAGPDLRVQTAVAGLRGGEVSALYQEPGGPLWHSTPSGLVRLAGEQITHYGAHEGLCGNAIHAILDDGHGMFWLGSNHGILRVPKRELEELAEGTRTRVSCTAYGRGDGMENPECHGGYQASGFRGRDGRLWFATLKGVVSVDPAKMEPANALPPPVVIESAHVDGQALSLRSPGQLPAGARRLEIDYTALSLVASEKVRFRHRLLGFDSDWVDAGARRTVSYTNLPPGDYSFEVKACNNDGVWNEEGARWDLRVAPFFHETNWFWGGVVLSAGALALALHHLRARGLRLRNALLSERARISQDVHDSLSQIMTGVILQLDVAQTILGDGPQPSRPYLERATQLARQGMEEMRRTLRGLPSPELERTHLARALLRRAQPLIEGTSVQLQVQEEGEPRRLPAGVEHELFQVGQEALTNALRHGRPRKIEVLVSYLADGVRLSVRDDGRGFERAVGERLGGLGLAGMERRVSGQRGTFEVRSSAGAGTTVTVFLPCTSLEGRA